MAEDTVKDALARLDQAVNDIEANSRRLSGKDLERNYEAAKDALIAAVRADTIRFMHELDDAAAKRKLG